MNNLYNESDKKASDINPNIIIANNKFALSLIKEIQKEDQNIFLSPFSISLALSMICNGAEGLTRDIILDSLYLNGSSLQTINENIKNLLFSLENIDNQVNFYLSNSIWNKPYFFYIRDDRSGLILFMGKILNPS